MIAAEFEEFASELRVLEEIFSKKLSDSLIKTYWAALRDLPLAAMKAGIARHIRFGKFFPKPAELRRQNETPRDEVSLSADARHSIAIALQELAEKDPQHNGHLKGALALNRRTWAEFEARDPELAKIEKRIGQVGYLVAVEQPDSPHYEEAVKEDRALRDRRLMLWQRRAAA